MQRITTRLTHTLVVGAVVAAVAFALGCGGGDAEPDAAPEVDAPPAVGTVSLTWTISDGVNQVGCVDVAALTVSVQLVPIAGGAGNVEGFPCGDGMGTSAGIPVGAYNVTLGLVGSGGVTVGERQSLFNIEVTADRDTALGQIDFVVQ